MATQTIVQSLAYISWALLLVLALGSFALAHLLRQVTDVTSGYAGFTASTAAVLAVLAWLTDGGLPYPDHLDIHAAPGLDGSRGLALAVFAMLVALSALRYYRGHRARWLGPLAILAGVAAVALGALGWASGDQMGLPLLVELLSLAAVSGGSLAAVILAHWYLVTPRLSERPLVLTTQVLMVALGVELLLFLVWQTVSAPDGRPFSTFTGPEALFVWLQLIVGLIFPLVLTYMAYRTALTRSMESATGLIYIELAAVLASTIVVAGLAFAVGLLV
jgi:hypothetical protein